MNPEKKEPDLYRIREVVCIEIGMPIKDLKNKTRSQKYAYVKQIYAYIVRQRLPNITRVQISKMLGYRDHTTVSRGIKLIESEIKQDNDATKQLVERIMKQLK